MKFFNRNKPDVKVAKKKPAKKKAPRKVISMAEACKPENWNEPFETEVKTTKGLIPAPIIRVARKGAIQRGQFHRFAKDEYPITVAELEAYGKKK